MTKPGILITFEGGEGAGKTTQIKMLKEALKKDGYDVSKLDFYEPGGTKEAELARIIVKRKADKPLSVEHYPGVPEMVKDFDISPLEQAFQFFFARSHQFRTKLRAEIEAGKVIILDRSIDSTVVYQGHAQDTELIDYLRFSNETILRKSGIVINRTYLIDVPAEIGKARVNKQRGDDNGDFFDEQEVEFYEKLREGYLAELEYTDSLDLTNPHYKRIRKVDGDQTPEAIFDEVYSDLKKLL